MRHAGPARSPPLASILLSHRGRDPSPTFRNIHATNIHTNQTQPPPIAPSLIIATNMLLSRPPLTAAPGGAARRQRRAPRGLAVVVRASENPRPSDEGFEKVRLSGGGRVRTAPAPCAGDGDLDKHHQHDPDALVSQPPNPTCVQNRDPTKPTGPSKDLSDVNAVRGPRRGGSGSRRLAVGGGWLLGVCCACWTMGCRGIQRMKTARVVNAAHFHTHSFCVNPCHMSLPPISRPTRCGVWLPSGRVDWGRPSPLGLLTLSPLTTDFQLQTTAPLPQPSSLREVGETYRQAAPRYAPAYEVTPLLPAFTR
jgi:hypothetical protein